MNIALSSSIQPAAVVLLAAAARSLTYSRTEMDSQMNTDLSTDLNVVTIPAAGDYAVDRSRSTISFTTRHLFGLAPVRGTFQLREAGIRVAEQIEQSSARASIVAMTVDTGNATRDTAVRSARYLDVEQYPDLSFASTALVEVDGRWVLRGLLTVCGRSCPLDVRVDAAQPDGSRLRLRATSRIDRYEFGLTAMKGMAGRYLELRLDLVADRT
ncbi:MAG TPA: YceI family protein [Pseudonocardiaceae bacterium]|jgi:polyisoprenoid-binding protein YceI|nr:YceI family protein [Pseudonocardiaceae bacterium]